MAKIKLNPLFDGISGTVGDVVFKKSKNGQIYISSRPSRSKAKRSEAQKANQERFKLANAYAKAAMADPALRAMYEELAEAEGQSAFTMARSDYFNGNDLLSKKQGH
jgi:hypothetical protein